MRASLDEAVVLGRTAQRIWSERGNPPGWIVRTPLGAFETPDRTTWRTADGAWNGELRRSRNGHHVYLALFEEGTYLGRYDTTGWHAASSRSRVHQLRSSQLPLRLAA